MDDISQLVPEESLVPLKSKDLQIAKSLMSLEYLQVTFTWCLNTLSSCPGEWLISISTGWLQGRDGGNGPERAESRNWSSLLSWIWFPRKILGKENRANELHLVTRFFFYLSHISSLFWVTQYVIATLSIRNKFGEEN